METVSEPAKASSLSLQTDNITSQEKKEINTASDTIKFSSVGFVASFDSTSAEKANLILVGLVAEFDETAAPAVNPPSVGFAAQFDNFADDPTQTKTNIPYLNLNDKVSYVSRCA